MIYPKPYIRWSRLKPAVSAHLKLPIRAMGGIDKVTKSIDYINDNPYYGVAFVVVFILVLGGICAWRESGLKKCIYSLCGKTDADDDGMYREGGQKTRIRHEGGI